jgi:hypothetical protein
MIPARRLITKASPLVTDNFVAYEGDTIKSHLSLAVWLIDEFTGKLPVADLTVRLKETDKKPIKNPSGYYCFTDVNAGDYTIIVKPTVPLRTPYFQKEIKITVPMPNRLEPVTEIILNPALSYPFPSHTTLIRGFAVKSVGGKLEPVPNIPVYRLMPDNTRGVETTTDHNGEYALYVKKIEIADGDAGMEVIVEAESDGHKKQEGLGIILREGEGFTFSLNMEFTA